MATSRARPEAADCGDLIDAVQQLREEVHVLRETIDELREIIEHTVYNQLTPLPRPVHIHSMSADPAAKNFQVNEVTSEQVSRLRESLAGPESDCSAEQTRSSTDRHDDESLTVNHGDCRGDTVVIRCEDQVSVPLADGRSQTGFILEIDHIRRRVLVRFADDGSEQWHQVENVSHAVSETTPTSMSRTQNRLF